MKKKLIFCIGTGRCGTSSLSFLLNSQNSSLFTHELFPILPWSDSLNISAKNKEVLQYKIFQLIHQTHNYDIVGDSGMYYLPYVELIIKSFANNKDFDIKFVVLKREKTETVKSFEKKFKAQGNNPLQNHDGIKNEWDNSFPKYSNFLTMKEAIEKYYDDYYSKAEKLAKDYSKVFKIFDIEVLNSKKELSFLFDYLEINDPLFIESIRKNTSKDFKILKA